MEFLSLAKQRCSVRKYKTDEIEKEKLDKQTMAKNQKAQIYEFCIFTIFHIFHTQHYSN